ncbi:MAG TPA: hypothetical protein VF123_02425 [Candidatus Sulfotelmatobacter sp.]
MPLSTSNSERSPELVAAHTTRPSLRRATILAIASVVLVVLAAEALSRYAFPRISQIESRITSDERELTSIHPARSDSAPTLLLAGNSLLLRGLDYPKIRQDMAPHARVFRYVIENTEYLDWYYGLHHLFESGVRPSTVVLCLNLGQTVSSLTLGDYSARHLFGVSELLPVAHDAGMNPTQITELVLAHWSAFYASRATIRNFVLNKADPPYAAALHELADSTKRSVPADEELVAKARGHLRAMQQLCARYGVQFVLLIPPSLSHSNDLLASAADAEHISFYYPLPVGSLGPENFRADRSHLNEKGAAVFTAAIERCLETRISKSGE